MNRYLCTFFSLSLALAAMADDKQIETDFDYLSPDGRFALRMMYPKNDDHSDIKLDLVEKDSGKVMVNLGSVTDSQIADALMVWAPDSKAVAYGSRDDEPGARVISGGTTVFFRNGSGFEKVSLPDNLPSPKIAFAKGAGADVKAYGGVVKPLRWLKSDVLELSRDEMMLSRVDDKSYTGIVQFTVAFDAKHLLSVKTVGKSKTKVE